MYRCTAKTAKKCNHFIASDLITYIINKEMDQNAKEIFH